MFAAAGAYMFLGQLGVPIDEHQARPIMTVERVRVAVLGISIVACFVFVLLGLLALRHAVGRALWTAAAVYGVLLAMLVGMHELSRHSESKQLRQALEAAS